MKAFYRITFDSDMYCGFTDEFIQYKEEVDGKTALSMECLWAIYPVAKYCLKKPGIFMECGVDRGGSARFLHRIIEGKKELHLFDTFSGMPETTEIDFHKKGDFPGGNLKEVKAFVGGGIFHPGRIPETFPDVESIAFAHVDCDLYSSTKACCEFIFPRLSGIIVFDDYGRRTTMGVRKAVDEYFDGTDALTLANLTTGQLVVMK